MAYVFSEQEDILREAIEARIDELNELIDKAQSNEELAKLDDELEECKLLLIDMELNEV